MKKITKIVFGFVIFASCFFSILHVSAQESKPQNLPGFPNDKFYLGKIIEIRNGEKTEEGGQYTPWLLTVQIKNGDEKGKMVEVLQYIPENSPDELGIKKSETVVIQKSETLGESEYNLYDKYRILPMALILLFFFALVIALSRLKGLGSIAGLIISIVILSAYIVPMIVAGHNPLLISLSGAFAIAVLSIYSAHGLNKRTSVALMSTIITLGIAGGLSILFVWLSKLSGMGSEETFYLQINGLQNLNLQGLLLGGILIGVLGVLDDITTAQTAVVDELRGANPNLSPRELYKRSISVGKEHIASLVNTLVLAYAGASFPLFLLFAVNPNNVPFWVTLNSEFIAEEFVRTLVGSVALVLAVPIATILAVRFLKKGSSNKTAHRH